MNLKELNEKRRKAIADARAISAAADKENRGLTAEESKNFDALMDSADNLKKSIESEQRLAEAEAALAEVRTDAPEARTVETADEPVDRRSTKEYMGLFRRFVRGGRDAVMDAPAVEIRALQKDLDIQGGFMVAPKQLVSGLLKFLDNMVFIRRLATVEQVPTAASLGVVSLDADPDDADWTVELGTGNEDSAMAFGGRELHPNPFAKRIKISNDLIAMRSDVENLVQARLGYKFGVTEEKAFLTGHGARQPLGLFTASNNGISTSRDVSTDNTTTAFTTDGLKNAKYSVKAAYWPQAQWLFHRDAVKMLAKLKDGEGRYLWSDSIRVGEPDMLLGRPVNVSEYAPNTFTTGLYVGLFGDFSFYWIADALDMRIQRLTELYAATNQTGLIGRKATDGQPVLEEAFARVKLA